jgi:hypothetical protein
MLEGRSYYEGAIPERHGESESPAGSHIGSGELRKLGPLAVFELV